MNIKELAEQAGIGSPDLWKLTVNHMAVSQLDKFAELVAAHEREECKLAHGYLVYFPCMNTAIQNGRRTMEREALQMCLEYIETDAHERKHVRHAIQAALAQPAQEPVAREWNFCERCGKRTADLTVIHTCTPPQGDA